MEVGIDQALERAARFEQTGQVAEAESVYQQLLAAFPDHARALFGYGSLIVRCGRPDVGAQMLRRAALASPYTAECWASLGDACWAIGDTDGAIQALRRVVLLAAGNASAQYNLALALLKAGDTNEALFSARRAVELKPDWAEAQNNLGALYGRLGRQVEGLPHLHRAVQLKPDWAEAWFNLGDALAEHRQVSEAVEAYARATALKPELAEAHDRLGVLLHRSGRPELAIGSYARAIALRPNDGQLYNRLGASLHEKGDLDDALRAYQRAIELDPNHAEPWSNLGSALRDTGRIGEAIAAFRRAARTPPLASSVASNLLYALHFDPACTPDALAAEEAAWDRQFAQPLRASIEPHANDRSPERRLRVGYVSPDFFRQAESHFVLPLLENHDRSAVEVHCYASVRRPDEVTERHRKAADHWHEVAGLPNEALAAKIRGDGIDVLVDLTMHMAYNRLLTFARKPAPVQISWLAYPGRTGLETIDYVLTDGFMEPAPTNQERRSERALRLPNAWCCYDPVAETPDVGPAPCAVNGYITLGSMNSFGKVNERVLALWARVLEAVPDSRLIILAPEGSHREQTLGRLGAVRDRVTFVSPRPRRDYLEYFGLIDVMLDAFPYNGITTTCDALWMGVPVLSLVGAVGVPQSRAGLSLLNAAGLGEWVAGDEAAYVLRAVEISADRGAIEALRRGLREKMKASPLMDGRGFARAVEKAYRTAWRSWCGVADG